MFKIETMGKGYSQRTKYNCKTADFTVALAFNFKSGGEIMTHKFARPRLYQLPILEFGQDEVDEFCRKYRGYMCETLHIAGNGAYTLYKYWGTPYQKMADDMVLLFLEKALEQVTITKVFSGGQTGIDEAGAKAALKLGISLEVNMPNNYMTRNYQNADKFEKSELAVLKRLIGK